MENNSSIAVNESNPYAAPRSIPTCPKPTCDVVKPTPRQALVSCFIQTVVLLVFAALLLDGGRFFNVCRVIIVGQCALILLISLRRGVHWTRTDTLAVKWGLFVLVPAVSIAAVWAGKL